MDFSSEIINDLCLLFSLPSKSNWKMEYLKHPAMDYSKRLILKHFIMKTFFFQIGNWKNPFLENKQQETFQGKALWCMHLCIWYASNITYLLFFDSASWKKRKKSNMYHKQKKQIFLALTVKIIDMYINSLHCWYHSNCDH